MNDPILAFLAQPENLPLALEIHQRVIQLREELHSTFWKSVKVELEQRLSNSPQSQDWELVDEATKAYNKDWASISLHPKLPNRLFLAPRLEQGTPRSGFRLYAGMKWSKEQQKGLPDMLQTLALEKALREHGFRQTPWWIGVKDLPLWIRKDDFLIKMANEQASFIVEMADNFWSLFREHEKLLVAANEELAGG
ncbi:MAG: hypothetical protein KDE56_07765 [Anaerolineales bacterium]|nr:hypothetical protein [Anaerolineales bacterium]